MREALANWYLLENSAEDILFFVGILIIGLVMRRFFSNSFSKIIFRFLPNQFIQVQDCIQLLRKPVELLLFWIFLYFSIQYLHVPIAWHFNPVEKFGLLFLLQKAFETAVIITFTWLVVRMLKVIILIAQQKWQGVEQKSKQQFIPFLNDLGMVFIIAGSGFVLLGRVFQVDVMALITGLGLGGLALALAARETLENLFASFTIFLDLPFVVGDSIQAGSISGDVEKIGFRSTRLRAVDGNLIMIPNRLLTSQSLENMSERNFRRAKYTLSCSLQSKPEQIKSILPQIEQLILAEPLCKKKAPKIIFEGFGTYSLDISVTYFVQTSDFGKFQNVKQEINLGILNCLHQAGINLVSSATAPNMN
ncbi:mechanosensitive ion channel family protein [Aquirufa nivalisilvae]|uniref:mechanosensitive ion channel family protein n=1 Tax=Aquirufa nivalisilvae TaxID=2516557 RepID=UPI001032E801|nr:mechanosensitive ion channel domain-containing protein [Aquirufa nivalisilvae]TBH70899.1 mechanosensitive ion channel [Aquirufa nivalisilvae]